MDDLNIGTYPPMFPRNIFIEKQIQSIMEGKRIINTSWEKYYTGEYSWHGDSVPGFDELQGHTIVLAGASYVLTDKGALVFYSYTDGGLRYFHKGEAIDLPKTKKATSHGYHAKIYLDDGSCFGVNQYGWGTLFRVFKVENQIDNERTGKYSRYPFLPKSPLDVTDEEDFTYDRFRGLLSDNPAANIIESCATAKGAFRIDIPVMNYILLLSKVHPRTKTRALTDDEIKTLFDNIVKLVEEYKTEVRVCVYTDIYGKNVPPHNDVLWMTSAVLGAPCPICGTPIDATPAAGTKMYFCPSCQVINSKRSLRND